MSPTNDKTSTILRLKKVAYIPVFQDRFGRVRRMYIRVEELEVKDPVKSTERHLRCLDYNDRGRPVQMQAMEVDVGGFRRFSGYAVITLQHIKWDISRRNKCIHKEWIKELMLYEMMLLLTMTINAQYPFSLGSGRPYLRGLPLLEVKDMNIRSISNWCLVMVDLAMSHPDHSPYVVCHKTISWYFWWEHCKCYTHAFETHTFWSYSCLAGLSTPFFLLFFASRVLWR